MGKSLASLMLILPQIFTCALATQWINPEVAGQMSASELDKARESALAGSGDDAYRLSQFYGHHRNLNFIDYYFFLRLSAEQGDCRGILEFSDFQKKKEILDVFRKGNISSQSVKECKTQMNGFQSH